MGTVLLYVLLGLSACVFAVYLFGPEAKRASQGRALAWLLTIVSGFTCLLLLSYFTKGAYQIRYVYENSARELPLLYKVSGLWAGQEGTFLLWMFLTALCMVIAAKRFGEFEAHAMMLATVAEMVLVVLLIRHNPFQVLAQAPQDGMGLNPLLKNPWMAIHPPVVFLGYALATIPFGLSVAGVARGDFDGWAAAARPWAIAAWGILGIGIALGSFWAYEVLGWGGYWGWDPVENASLLPWFTLGGLVHGLLLQKRKAGFALWNVGLAQASFLLVFFGTFLTRSGVLSNFSVHSFQGLDLYTALLACLILFTAIAVITTGVAASKLKSAAGEVKKSLANSLLSWTMQALLILCFFVLLGTTSPILTSWFLPQPAPVTPGFYNGITYVLALALAILAAMCPSYFLKMTGGSSARAGAYVGFGILTAIIAGAAGVYSGAPFLVKLGGAMQMPRLVLLPLMLIGGAAIAANVHAFAITLGRRRWSAAAYLSHIGLALMIVGVLFTSGGARAKHVVLGTGETVKWHGYTFAMEDTKLESDSALVTLRVTRGGSVFSAPLRFVDEQMNNRDVKRPFIHKSLLHDLYLSPSQLMSSESPMASGNVVEIQKGKSETIGGAKVTFKAFDLAKMQSGIVGIVLEVEKDGKTTQVTPEFGAMQNKGVKDTLEVGGVEARVTGIDATSKTVQLTLPGKGAASPHMGMGYVVAFEAMYKPLISVLWLGMICIAAGTLLAVWRRLRPKTEEEK